MEWLQIVTYLIAPVVFTVLGAPIAAVLFRSLPRRGAPFALPTALVPFTIVVFWIGQFTFGLQTLLVGVAVVLCGSVAALRLGGEPEWRSVAAMVGVFSVGFCLMVAFRAGDPGITPAGGEQFLHFGLVNALGRAETLPPADMWFAGKSLRYYYGTQLQVTGLSMLTGTPIRYGFNLGIATFYGLLFVVAYGVSGAIVQRQGHSYRLGGVFGAFFVALAGPTTTAIRFLTPSLPAGVARPVERAAFGFVAARFNDGNLARTVTDLSNPFDWTWWYTRYVVPGTIQEVPLYSFVKADLHGHTFANGYVLFAGALGLAYYATPVAARMRRRALVFGGLGGVAGLFGFMNTWSLPTAAGVTVLAVAAADAHPTTLLPEPWARRVNSVVSPDSRLGGEAWRLLCATVAGAVVLLIGVVIASPFLVFGAVPSNNGIGLFPPRSQLGPFLVIYAGLVTVFALAVAVRGGPTIDDRPRRWLGVGGLGLTTVGVVSLLFDLGVVVVLGSLVVAGWLLVRTDRGGFALVLLIAGAGLLLSFEFVHARLPLIDNPRWNTSLKVAVQGWTLGAAGAGAVTAVLVSHNVGRLARLTGSQTGETPSRLRPLLSMGVVGMVLLASAVFPTMVVATEIGSPVVEDRYPASVDGHLAAERFHADEYPALLWLTHREGQPTLVEAPGRSYGWTSPAATFSGLPTVVGWHHEAEYRGKAAYQRRVDRVDTIYTGRWDAAARNLTRYDVTYVYVGPNERDRYGTALRSFDREPFTVAFEGGAVTIYAVNRSRIRPG